MATEIIAQGLGAYGLRWFLEAEVVGTPQPNPTNFQVETITLRHTNPGGNNVDYFPVTAWIWLPPMGEGQDLRFRSSAQVEPIDVSGKNIGWSYADGNSFMDPGLVMYRIEIPGVVNT